TIRLVTRGDSFNSATMYAYNMTKGVDIPTGLEGINLGTNPQDNATTWDRLVFRMGNSYDSYVDNAYISDYVHSGVTAEVVSPVDGEYPVEVNDVTLSWLSGEGADSHKVYFGTDAASLNFEIDTNDISYLLPYTLENGVTYYWRIDEVVDGVDNEGFVWSFTTQFGALDLPSKIAYEGFDYTPYVALKSGGNGFGGWGWATGWERVLGAWCYVTVGNGSLDTAMDDLYGTVGNKIQHPNSSASGNDAMRKLEHPIDLRADQDYYISYLAMGDADTYNSVSFRLLESKSASGFGVDMFYEGYPNVATPTAYIRDFGGGWTANPVAAWASGVVSLVVVKIEANTTEDDVVSVCLFDASNPLPMDEPSVWQQSVSANKNTVYPWLQFMGRSDSYDQWHIDEIHVGTDWGAVKCTDPEGCDWMIDVNEPNISPVITVLDPAELKVYEADSAITVDGDPSEWAGSRWYNVRFQTGYNAANAADVTEAEVSLKWDPNNAQVVYVVVKVTDTDQILTDAPTAWNSGDNLEVRFSVNDTSTDTTWYDNRTYDTAQYYHVFPRDNGGTWCSLGSIGDPDTDDPATDDIDVAYATSVVDDVIVYEMALPTYSLFDINTQSGTKVSLTEGEVIAFNLQINSVNDVLVGGLFVNQDHKPNNWFKFEVTTGSGLE
ncbi:MAG: hypothetical protein MIO92_11650, partial [Methanosarcinaceae archaeon]|nr:hypothetical protein [Methanosarcinaceae archaeon]